MGKKIPFILVSFLLLLIACKNNTSDEATKKEQEASVMYEPSELATLMLYMHRQHEAWKTSIENDSFDDAFPQEFLGIYTVTPTDSAVRTDEFIAFADDYVAKVEKLLKAKRNKKQVKLYNASIDACIACHNKFCQGPIDKIKKLYIAN